MINGGSSSITVALFVMTESPIRLLHGNFVERSRPPYHQRWRATQEQQFVKGALTDELRRISGSVCNRIIWFLLNLKPEPASLASNPLGRRQACLNSRSFPGSSNACASGCCRYAQCRSYCENGAIDGCRLADKSENAAVSVMFGRRLEFLTKRNLISV